MEGTGAHPLDQPPDQRQVAVLTDRASQPQPGRDHHSERHPDYASLSLDAYLVGLHLAEVPRLLDEMFLNGLALAARACLPRRDRPLVEPKGHHNGLHRTAMGKQRDDQRPKVTRGAQTIKDGPVRCGKGLGSFPKKMLPNLSGPD